MKMISSTSMMSTSGVTLMPLMPSSVSSDDIAMSRRLPRRRRRLEVRDQLAAEALGRDRARLQDALEVVVRGNRGQRDEQTDRGRDQCLGDAAHHLRAGVAARGRQIRGRVNDAEHRAEQADERRVVADRAQEREAALELQLLVDE